MGGFAGNKSLIILLRCPFGIRKHFMGTGKIKLFRNFHCCSLKLLDLFHKGSKLFSQLIIFRLKQLLLSFLRLQLPECGPHLIIFRKGIIFFLQNLLTLQ